MKLTEDKSPAQRRLAAAAGGLAGLVAVALLWLGLTSSLVGLAYHPQKGFWVPCLVGLGLTGAGLWLLIRGLSGLARNLGRKSKKG